MGDPEPQTPQQTQTRTQAATAAIKDKAPEATQTFDAIIKASKGDLKGAGQEIQTERGISTGNPVVDRDIAQHRGAAAGNLYKGKAAEGIKEAKEALGAQLGAELANQLYNDKYGPGADPKKAQADLDAMRSFVASATGDKAKGDEAATALEKLVEANHQRNEDLKNPNPFSKEALRSHGPGGGKDMYDVLKAAEKLGDIVKGAADAAIAGGDAPVGDPKAPATPAVKTQGQGQVKQ